MQTQILQSLRKHGKQRVSWGVGVVDDGRDSLSVCLFVSGDDTSGDSGDSGVGKTTKVAVVTATEEFRLATCDSSSAMEQDS